MQNYKLKVQILNKENFKPFGKVIRKDSGLPPIKKEPPVFTDRAAFTIEGQGELVYAVLQRKEFCFSKMERHLKMTQGFIPISSGPAIITVAPPTHPERLEDLPSPSSVQAFLMDKDTSIILNKGTWHGTIMPLDPTYSYILVTRAETTDESIRPLYDGDVQIRDLGVEFNIEL